MRQLKGAALALAICGFIPNLAGAQQQQQTRSPALVQAEQNFDRFSERDRVLLQLMLIAAGSSNAVPNPQFTQRTFDSIRSFQTSAGFQPTGSLDQQQISTLRSTAGQVLRQWQMRVVSLPTTQHTLWVPTGFGITSERVEAGLSFANNDRSLTFSFLHFQSADFANALPTMRQIVNRNNGRITFELARQDFVVLSYDNSETSKGYMRFQRDVRGMSGFIMQWRTDRPGVRGDALSTLMSASLWDSANRTGMMKLDALMNLVTPASQPQGPQTQGTQTPGPQPSGPQATGPTGPAPGPGQQGQAPPPPQQQQQPQPPPQPPRPSMSTGTGFFVSREGHILTNAHVVEGCSHVEIRQLGQAGVRARIMSRDRTNDLAIVASDIRPQSVGLIRSTAKLGEQVVTFGFPLSGSLSTSGNFTIGNVTSLAGLGDDSRFIQMSTPVQPGNSGGALLDQSGHVVAVVTSKLNAVRTAAATGDIPQNVNFAVKAQVALGFLETHRVPIIAAPQERPLSSVELAEAGRAMTVQLVCQAGQ
jgi:serine protease Do